MKVYTKTGDTGTTALFGGTRVPKHHIRIESYGTVDELNSYIGLIRDQEMNQLYKNVLIEVQDRLFTVGAVLATPPEKETLKNGQPRLTKKPYQAKANIVMVCASAIESVRILFNSACANHPNGVGNSSGLLGKYFMDQTPSLLFASLS